MAPEQIRAKGVDRTTDVFAAGLVLWELLVGRRVYTASTDVALLAKRASGDAPAMAPSAAGAQVSTAVDAVVLHALELRPEARFGTAEEMAVAVGDALGVASPKEVAKWVDGLVHERIASLEAKVKDVERAFVSGELEEATQISRGAQAWESEHDVSVVFEVPDEPQERAPDPSPQQVPDLELPPAPPRSRRDVSVPVAPELALELAPTVASRSSRAPESARAIPPARISTRELASESGPASARGREPPASGPASVRGRLSGTSAPAPRFEESPTVIAPLLPQNEPRISRISLPGPPVSARVAPGRSPALTALLWVAALVLIAFAVRTVGPSLLRSLVVRGAAKRGVLLTVTSVSLQDWGLLLHEPSMQLIDASEVTLRAPDALVSIDWLGSPQKLEVRGYTAALRGSAATLTPQLALWASSSRMRLELSATSGHLSWPDAVAPGMGVEADGISAQAVLPDAAATDALTLHMETTSLTATVRGAPLGPWVARLDVAPEETKLAIALDPARPDAAPSVTLTASRTLGRVFSISVPRQRAARIGIPPAVLALGADPEIDLTLDAQLFPSGEPLNAHVKLSLYGVVIPALADAAAPTALADVTIEGGVNGSPTKPLKIQKGALKVRAFATPLSGWVKLEGGAIVVEATPQGLPGRKSPGPIVFDTRVWTQRPGP